MIIKNADVFDLDAGFIKKELSCKDGKLVSIKDECDNEIIDANGLYAIPGLIDIHFHGCMGYDFCDGSIEAMKTIAKYQLSQGITTICPASMTFSEEHLASIFKTAAEYNENEGAEFAGINMEGPFISTEKKGAQNGTYIHNPDVDMFLRLQEISGGKIKLVDIAPETKGAMEFIQTLKDKVRISLAHTTANYATASKAFQNGALHVTHLYNAMPPFHHREPGVIGAACDYEDCSVELITDSVHSHPSVVRTTFKMFGENRIILISDSMRATGLGDGNYTLGGQDVTVKGNKAVLTKEKNIAGSVTNLMDCVRIAVKKMGIPLTSAIRCASYNPAKAIGLEDRLGSLQIGKTANIILLDRDLNIRYVIKEGKIISKY